MECKTPKVNPKVNCGLWVMMCQCRFLGSNKGMTLVEGSHSRAGFGCVGIVGPWELFHLLLKFALKLKML